MAHHVKVVQDVIYDMILLFDSAGFEVFFFF